MNLYEILSLIVALGGLIVAIGGFAAVGINIYHLTKQTELLVKSVQGDIYASVTNNLATTKQIFIDYPELRPYFYSGLPCEKDDQNHARALLVAEHLLDFFDAILLEKAPLWPEAVWKKYIADSFKKSPILCDYLEEKQDWYTEELFRLMKDAKQSHLSLTKELNNKPFPTH